MTSSDLEILKVILECWCKDFRMKVSPSKTKILPTADLVCILSDLLSGESDCLEMVSQSKYLSVVQHRTPLCTF